MSEMERLAERLREYANLLNDEAGDMAPRNPLKSKLRAEERDLRDAATTLRALTAERDELRERAERAEGLASRRAGNYEILQRKFAKAEAREAKLREERDKAINALRPFALCVFYDNGDVTVSDMMAPFQAFSDAFFIVRRADRAALDQGEADNG
ncbi:MAG: hypothetical protein ACQEUZ_06385 [Pseudomonadota bacterium]